MPRVKKGAIVAYNRRTLTVTPHPTEPWRPPSVARLDSCWALGTVWQATRHGQVKEIVPAGADPTVTATRQKMLAKYEAVTRVLFIPSDRVDGPAMLQAATGVTWLTLEWCEEFVRHYLLTDRLDLDTVRA